MFRFKDNNNNKAHFIIIMIIFLKNRLYIPHCLRPRSHEPAFHPRIGTFISMVKPAGDLFSSSFKLKNKNKFIYFLILQTHKRFKRTLIYYDIDTQSANFRVNPLRGRQATKRRHRLKH